MKYLLAFVLLLAGAASAGQPPVRVGFDSEAGHLSSTSDDAIRQGILIAIDEINAAGGVLGGRPLELVERDNRSVPARGIANAEAFADTPDLVAMFTGKFSAVAIAQLPTLHERGLILLDPWGAADGIIDHRYVPSYTFRLSLRDGWAMPFMLAQARQRGLKRVGLMLPNNAWGRSNHAAALATQNEEDVASVVGVAWHNWGDSSFLTHYQQLRQAGAQAIVVAVNENDGAVLVGEIAALPAEERLPLISHWGVTGGNFAELTGEALQQIDFSVVQTYSFLTARRPQMARVLAAGRRLFGIGGAEEVVSPVGLAHAYDLTHILARAVELAGTTDRAAVRDALEQVRNYSGLIRDYPAPFTPERHEALSPEALFMAVFRHDGVLVPVTAP